MGPFYACQRPSPTRALGPLRPKVRVEPKKRSRHPIGPAEPVLQGILAPAAGQRVLDIIFLDQLARVGEDPLNGREPAARDLACEHGLIVAAESTDGDPLQ